METCLHPISILQLGPTDHGDFNDWDAKPRARALGKVVMEEERDVHPFID